MDTKDTFADLLTREEPLHKDLERFVTKDKPFDMLRHPLVFSIPYAPQMNAWLNKHYLAKKDAVEVAKEKSEHSSFIFLHERPYRLQAFLEINEYLNKDEYWELLSDIWRDSENIWQNKAIWEHLLKKHKVSSYLFMTEEERHFLADLPKRVTIYRGYTKGKNKNGFSYTLDKEKAEWFSKRFHSDKAGVLTRTVSRDRIFAYTNGRSEEEIIIL